jgi:hypothetical protein
MANLLAAEAEACPEPEPNLKFGVPMPFSPFFVGGEVNWQNASTCNLTNMAMIAQADISTNVYNDNETSQANIFVVNSDCEVDCDTFSYTNNQLDQGNVLNVSATQRTFTTNKAQQQLVLSVLQQASSAVKGIALLPQSSQASNVMNGYMRASMSMSTNIGQSCVSQQENVAVIDTGAASNVDISNNIFEQTNEASKDCNQLAITRNVSMQALTANLQQTASASSTGITLWFFVVLVVALILGFTVFSVTVVKTASKPQVILIIVGVVVLIIGACLLASWAATKNTESAWFGCSPGIPNGGCQGYKSYALGGQNIRDYDSPAAAQNACMNDSNCTALDWVWNPTEGDEAGTATFYTGEPTGQCSNIVGNTDDSPDDSRNIISIRPPAYRTVALGGETPNNDLVADVALDTDTGNLWYKMPPNFNSCNIYPPGSDAYNSAPWTFVAPHFVEASNADNAFKTLIPNSCGTAQCSQCGFESTQYGVEGTSNKIYIWIDPTQLISMDLEPNNDNSLYNYGTKTYEQWMAEIGNYEWDFSSPVGDPNIEPKEGDYFLVVFPYGPDDTVDPTGANWPTDDSQFEHYAFGQQYYLYPAVPVSSGGANGYAPFPDGDPAITEETPNPPLNRVNGFGVVPEFQAYQSTLMKYQTRNQMLLYMGLVLLGLGVVVIIGALIYAAVASPKPAPESELAAEEMPTLVPGAEPKPTPSPSLEI